MECLVKPRILYHFTHIAVGLLIGATISKPVVANEAPVMDFLGAYRIALSNNPQWQIAQQRHASDIAGRRMAMAGLLPQISYNYSRAKNHLFSRQQNQFGSYAQKDRYTSYSSGLSLSQPLFDMATYEHFKQGSEQAHAAQYTEERARQTLAIQVLKAYISALYSQDQLTLIEAQKKSLEQNQKQAHVFFLEGQGTRTDEIEISSRLRLLDAQENEAQNNIVDTRDQLAMTLGIPVLEGTLKSLESTSPLSLSPAKTMSEWQQDALAHNPELEASQYLVQSTQEKANQARAGHLPTVKAFIDKNISDSNDVTELGQHYNSTAVGIEVNLPLYQGGLVSAQTDQAVDQLQEAQSQLDNTRLQILEDLGHQYRILLESKQLDAAYVYAIQAAKEQINATRKSIQGGERTYLDLLNAEQQYYQAINGLKQARYNEILAWLSLHWEAGDLTLQDVSLVSSLFQNSPDTQSLKISSL